MVSSNPMKLDRLSRLKLPRLAFSFLGLVSIGVCIAGCDSRPTKEDAKRAFLDAIPEVDSVIETRVVFDEVVERQFSITYTLENSDQPKTAQLSFVRYTDGWRPLAARDIP